MRTHLHKTNKEYKPKLTSFVERLTRASTEKKQTIIKIYTRKNTSSEVRTQDLSRVKRTRPKKPMELLSLILWGDSKDRFHIRKTTHTHANTQIVTFTSYKLHITFT
eukprot:GHVR01055695.1.p1 GENE.GHVR01055695.1~~GHVR01055695.1.p1  ORF type:complete len:107 (+),score=14.38 GHVR01055695.1:172-492(+)